MIEKKVSQNNNSLRFFFVVILIYIILAFFNFELFHEALNRFLDIVKKILPLLAVVFFAMFLTGKFLTEDFVKKHLGNESGVKAYFYTIVAGILISGPPYALFPLLKGLQEKGMSDRLIAVLLYNRNIKIQFIPALIYYFGLAFTIIISFYIIIFSILSGVLIERWGKIKLFNLRN
jgi:uncharacterized membrane protein YraQ (UPF0718 family)